MKYKKENIKRGFSLVETLVAVTILAFAILGPMTLTSMSLKSSSSTKNSLIAGNLAQEGIELIRAKIRNNNLECAPFCAGDDWINGLGSPTIGSVCFNANGCGIDARDLDPKFCGGGPGNSCVLRFETNNTTSVIDDGIYNHGGGSQAENPDTIFKRVIQLTEVVPGKELNLKVAVSWTEKFGNQKVVVEENTLNW